MEQKMFLPQGKNIFASRIEMCLPKLMLPRLASMEATLTSFQCRSLIMFPIYYYYVRDTLFPQKLFVVSLVKPPRKHEKGECFATIFPR